MKIAVGNGFTIVLLLGVACTTSLDEEELVDLSEPFADVRELCVQNPPAGMSQGTALSLHLASGSFLFFADTMLETGSDVAVFPNTEAIVTDSQNPCAIDYLRSANGDLLVPIALTDEEMALDQNRTDGRRTALWPRGGFAAGDSGFVFYQKLALSDYSDVVFEGTGVAQIGLDGLAERLLAQHYAGEPLLTWVAPNSDWGTGALLGNDGMAYVFGCYERAFADVGCRLGRVDPTRVALPRAYGYYDVEGKWSDRAERAAWVFSGASNLSGFYSPALGRYVLLYSEYLGNRVYAVTAPDPWGPFSEPKELMTALAPRQFWIGRVDVHPGYASADGKRFVFGYHTDNPAAPGLHFVEVTIR
jgi:hypothetical protein